MEEGLLDLAEDKLDSKDNMSRVEMKLTVKDVEKEKEGWSRNMNLWDTEDMEEEEVEETQARLNAS